MIGLNSEYKEKWGFIARREWGLVSGRKITKSRYRGVKEDSD